MIPVWIDEDMAESNPLKRVVHDKAAALLPDAPLDDALLEALLRK
jgi:hypothetical protein